MDPQGFSNGLFGWRYRGLHECGAQFPPRGERRLAERIADGPRQICQMNSFQQAQPAAILGVSTPSRTAGSRSGHNQIDRSHPMGTDDYSVELIAPLNCQIWENPLWHPEAATIFFLDIAPGIVHDFTPSTGVCRPFCQTRVTGGFTLQGDGSPLLFQDSGLCIVGMDGTQREVASNLCPENDRF